MRVVERDNESKSLSAAIFRSNEKKNPDPKRSETPVISVSPAVSPSVSPSTPPSVSPSVSTHPKTTRVNVDFPPQQISTRYLEVMKVAVSLRRWMYHYVSCALFLSASHYGRVLRSYLLRVRTSEVIVNYAPLPCPAGETKSAFSHHLTDLIKDYVKTSKTTDDIRAK